MRRSIDDFLRGRQPNDTDLLKRTTSLKIQFHREPDGRVFGAFTVEGAFGCGLTDDEELDESPEEGMQFVRDLLRQFEKTTPTASNGGSEGWKKGRRADDDEDDDGGDEDDGGSKIRAG